MLLVIIAKPRRRGVAEARRLPIGVYDTALRLARYFGMSPRFWLGLQMDYDLDIAEDEIGDRLSQEVVALVNQS